MRSENFGGIQVGCRSETDECPKPTVVHRSSGNEAGYRVRGTFSTS